MHGTHRGSQSPKTPKVGVVEGVKIDADKDLAEAKAAAASRASTKQDPSSAEAATGSATRLSPSDYLPLKNLVGEG